MKSKVKRFFGKHYSNIVICTYIVLTVLELAKDVPTIVWNAMLPLIAAAFYQKRETAKDFLLQFEIDAKTFAKLMKWNGIFFIVWVILTFDVFIGSAIIGIDNIPYWMKLIIAAVGPAMFIYIVFMVLLTLVRHYVWCLMHDTKLIIVSTLLVLTIVETMSRQGFPATASILLLLYCLCYVILLPAWKKRNGMLERERLHEWHVERKRREAKEQSYKKWVLFDLWVIFTVLIVLHGLWETVELLMWHYPGQTLALLVTVLTLGVLVPGLDIVSRLPYLILGPAPGFKFRQAVRRNKKRIAAFKWSAVLSSFIVIASILSDGDRSIPTVSVPIEKPPATVTLQAGRYDSAWARVPDSDITHAHTANLGSECLPLDDPAFWDCLHNFLAEYYEIERTPPYEIPGDYLLEEIPSVEWLKENITQKGVSTHYIAIIHLPSGGKLQHTVDKERADRHREKYPNDRDSLSPMSVTIEGVEYHSMYGFFENGDTGMYGAEVERFQKAKDGRLLYRYSNEKQYFLIQLPPEFMELIEEDLTKEEYKVEIDLSD